MKTIKLKSLELIDFKKAKKRKVEFADITEIIGDNGEGKTTIYNAFTWLLYGKDYKQSTRQTVYTLDENNNIIHHKEPTVIGVFDINNQEITLKRVLREKWTKKRGELTPELTGNETKYFVNDVPMNEKEFALKVNEILDEELFKLITLPTYFNGLKTDVRRKLLTNLVNVTNNDVAKDNKEFTKLLENLTNKKLIEFKKEIASKILNLKKEIAKIEPQIEGIESITPDSLDWQSLQKELDKKQEQLNKITEQIKDRTKITEQKLQKQTDLQKEIHTLESNYNDLRFDLESDFINKTSIKQQEQQQINSDVSLLNNAISVLKNDITSKETEYKAKETEIQDLRTRYMQIAQAEADISNIETLCPVCKREYDKEKIKETQEQVRQEFNARKVKQQTEINEKGLKLKNELEQIKTNIADKKAILQQKESELTKLQSKVKAIIKELEELEKQQNELRPSQQMIKLKESIDKKKAELSKMNIQKVDVSDLENKGKILQDEIKELEKQLNIKDEIDKNEKRIKELQDEGRKLNEQLTDYEKQQFVVEKFETSKMTMVEDKLNDMFTIVKFKMFRKQMNGGIEQICETLINGVPYSTDLNSGAKINAGVDIINTFSRVKGVTAPIFVDNNESVSIIIDTLSQLIKLTKVKGKKFEVINYPDKPKKLKQEPIVTEVKKEVKKETKQVPEQPKANGLLF